jgi:beta-galactosidase/beta-glucuronidase
VDTPHDFVSYGQYQQAGDEISNSQGNLPKNVSWYRKHFKLPLNWDGSHIELYVEGSYSVSTWYINGELLGTHSNGYTSAIYRLDNNTAGLKYDGTENVLAVFIDGRMEHCTGWWYEGAGLFRNSYLISSDPIHTPPHGIFASASVAGVYDYTSRGADPRLGVTATAVEVAVEALVENSAGSTFDAGFVSFVLRDQTGVVKISSAPMNLTGLSAPTTLKVTLQLPEAECWSVPRPYLYTLVTTVKSGSGTLLETTNTTVGVRGVAWDAQKGLLLNKQQVKMRGFCNHENFAGVGSAISERINLYRMQQMRGVGGNAWRASHNPPSPALLSLADRLGVLVLDENRILKTGLAQNMVDLVERDRNHPSVIFW